MKITTDIPDKVVEILTNNENLSHENFTKLNTPINRVSSLVYFLYNNFISNILPNLSILFVIFLYFIYNNFKFGLIFLFFNIIIILSGYFIVNKMIPEMYNCEDNLVSVESNIQEILNNFDKIIYRGFSQKESENLDKEINNVLGVHYKYFKKIVNKEIDWKSEGLNTTKFQIINTIINENYTRYVIDFENDIIKND